MWDAIPDKYETRCIINASEELVFDRVYEAINEKEAEARAYLNCARETKGTSDLSVKVKRI